jgi:hypothetical protein
LSTTALSTPRKQVSDLIRSEKLWLGAVALVYLAVTMRGAWLRPLIFHEFSTLFVSSTPTIGAMFRAIPTDGNPPLYFFLARLCLKLPIKLELALRLPAILGYFLAGVTVYWFVRRDAGRTYAWLAMSVFLGCGWSVYAIDARPYPLLLFFAGLALCCWQSYCRSGSRAALAGITLSVAGAICTHQYGVIHTLCPLAAGEAVRSLRRRRIDPTVITAGATGALTVLLTFPPMFRGQKPLLAAIRSCPVFSARPHISDLKLYGAILPRFIPALAILGIVLFLLWIALTPKRQSAPAGNAIPAEDWAAAVMAALLLPVILIVARLGTNYFQARYGIGSGLGIAMLCGMLLSRLRWRHADSLAWIAAAYCLTVGLLGLWFARKPPGVTSWTDPVLHAGGGDEPIVVANATEFSPLWWYSDEQMRSRVHYLSDLAYTGRQSGLVPEYSLMLERAYLPMRLDDYQTWLAGRRHFLLYCSGDHEFEWIRQRLADGGWRLRLLQSAPAAAAPGAKSEGHREMFEVSR